MNQEFRFPLVIDNGSYTTKFGFVGESMPRHNVPTLVGEIQVVDAIKKNKHAYEAITKNIFVGQEAYNRLSEIEAFYPVQNGIVKSIEQIEKLWSYYLLNKMQVNFERSPLFITKSPQQDQKRSERLIEFIFEKLNVPSVYFEYPAYLSMIGSGITTGIGFDSGHQTTHLLAAWDGKIIDESLIYKDIGGDNLTQKIGSKVKIEFQFNKHELYDIWNDIKQNHCIMAKQYKKVEKEHKIQMPDGQQFTIGQDRYDIAESLLTQYQFDSLPVQCVKKCQTELRNELFKNIVISGGNFRFRNTSERLGQVIFMKSPPRLGCGIITGNDLISQAWKGGSILGSLSSFQQIWITKKQYEEEGFQKIEKHCL